MSELPPTMSSVAFLRRLQGFVDARLGAPLKTHRPAPVGPAIVAAKKAFRRTFQPLINEMLGRQTQFNDEMIGWGRAITRDVESLERSMTALRSSIDLRLTRLEATVARLEEATNSTPSTTPRPASARHPKTHVGA